MALSDLTSEAGTDTAIGVDDLHRAGQRSVSLDRRHQFGVGQELVFEDGPIAMGLSAMGEPGAICGTLNRGQQAR